MLIYQQPDRIKSPLFRKLEHAERFFCLTDTEIDQIISFFEHSGASRPILLQLGLNLELSRTCKSPVFGNKNSNNRIGSSAK